MSILDRFLNRKPEAERSRVSNLVTTVRDHRRGCGWRQEGGMYLVADALAAPCMRLPIPLGVCPVCHSGIKQSRGWTWINPLELVKALGVDSKPVPCEIATNGEGPCPKCGNAGFIEQLDLCGVDWCGGCPLGGLSLTRAGLLWVGEKFYTVGEFLRESHEQGISRRISAVPNEFRVGETWVLLAHKGAIAKSCPREWPSDFDHLADLTHRKDCQCKGTGKINERQVPGSLEGQLLTAYDICHKHPAACECRGTAMLYEPGIFQAFKPQRIEYIVKGTESDDELQSMIDRGITPVRVERVDEEVV
jgi:hypothetical protein